MRELKFRTYDLLMRCYDDAPEMYVTTDGHLKPSNNKIIEQYTGLKDKNGKEIYEGDIVDDGYSRICEIRWSEHFTAFETINEEDGYVSNIWFVAKYGEVIGNIHENPELLKKEK